MRKEKEVSMAMKKMNVLRVGQKEVNTLLT
jgi:hypothetical protein